MLLIYINFLIFLQLINSYNKILIFSFFCLFLVLVIPFITYLISPKLRNVEKVTPYECGYESFDDSRGIFDLHFFIITILFILFDLEISFIFPWLKLLYLIGFTGF